MLIRQDKRRLVEGEHPAYEFFAEIGRQAAKEHLSELLKEWFPKPSGGAAAASIVGLFGVVGTSSTAAAAPPPSSPPRSISK